METVKCQHCGAVDNFSTSISGPHVKATCNECHEFIKFLPQNKPVTKIPFGKYRDREIASMRSEEEIKYLQWFLNLQDVKDKYKTAIAAHLKSLNR